MLSGLTVFRKHHTNSYLINTERHEDEKSAVNKTRFGSSAPKYAHFKILLFIAAIAHLSQSQYCPKNIPNIINSDIIEHFSIYKTETETLYTCKTKREEKQHHFNKM